MTFVVADWAKPPDPENDLICIVIAGAIPGAMQRPVVNIDEHGGYTYGDPALCIRATLPLRGPLQPNQREMHLEMVPSGPSVVPQLPWHFSLLPGVYVGTRQQIIDLFTSQIHAATVMHTYGDVQHTIVSSQWTEELYAANQRAMRKFYDERQHADGKAIMVGVPCGDPTAFEQSGPDTSEPVPQHGTYEALFAAVARQVANWPEDRRDAFLDVL